MREQAPSSGLILHSQSKVHDFVGTGTTSCFSFPTFLPLGWLFWRILQATLYNFFFPTSRDDQQELEPKMTATRVRDSFQLIVCISQFTVPSTHYHQDSWWDTSW